MHKFDKANKWDITKNCGWTVWSPLLSPGRQTMITILSNNKKITSPINKHNEKKVSLPWQQYRSELEGRGKLIQLLSWVTYLKSRRKGKTLKPSENLGRGFKYGTVALTRNVNLRNSLLNKDKESIAIKANTGNIGTVEVIFILGTDANENRQLNVRDSLESLYENNKHSHYGISLRFIHSSKLENQNILIENTGTTKSAITDSTATLVLTKQREGISR